MPPGSAVARKAEGERFKRVHGTPVHTGDITLKPSWVDVDHPKSTAPRISGLEEKMGHGRVVRHVTEVLHKEEKVAEVVHEPDGRTVYRVMPEANGWLNYYKGGQKILMPGQEAEVPSSVRKTGLVKIHAADGRFDFYHEDIDGKHASGSPMGPRNAKELHLSWRPRSSKGK